MPLLQGRMPLGHAGSVPGRATRPSGPSALPHEPSCPARRAPQGSEANKLALGTASGLDALLQAIAPYRNK